MPIIIKYDNGLERKIIGTMDYDRREFSRKVSASKHLYKTLDAWGMDAEHFKEVLLPNNYTIIITDVEEHIKYWTTAREFNEHPATQYLHFKVGPRDHGAQLFLPRQYWYRQELGKTEVFPPDQYIGPKSQAALAKKRPDTVKVDNPATLDI